MDFDTHIHSEGEGTKELLAMENGIKRVVSYAFYPISPSAPETMIDMFRKLTTFEVSRAEKGITLYPAIGVHPRCIPLGYHKVFSFMEENPSKAFGEIGLETASDQEVAVVDHTNERTAGKILKAGYWTGLTLQPGKLSREEVEKIVEKYGFERFLLNSDTGFSDDELFAVSKIEYLLQKFDAREVEKLAFRNAEKFQ